MIPVFLDRDDTLIRCTDLPEEAWAGGLRGDTTDPNWVIPLPRAIDACCRLVANGHVIIMITNQGLVARGHGLIADTTAVNDRVRSLFVDESGQGLIAACYACPFHPKGRLPELTREHPWRKPAGGMITAAADELGLDLSQAWMIGDAERDVEAGLDAGLMPERCRRVGPGFGDLADRVDEILSASQTSGQRLALGNVLDSNALAGNGLGDSGPDDGGNGVPKTATPAETDDQELEMDVRPASHGVLRARTGQPLDDPQVRDTVVAAAHGIAERTGVRVFSLTTSPTMIEVAIDGPRLVALGFLAELRRSTNAWFARAHGGLPLWAPTQDGSGQSP